MDISLKRKNLPVLLLLLFFISGIIVMIFRFIKGKGSAALPGHPTNLAQLNALPIVEPPVLVPIGVLGQLLDNVKTNPVYTNPSDLIVPVPIPKVFETYTPDVVPIKDFNVPVVPTDIDQDPRFIKVYTDGSISGDILIKDSVRNFQNLD